MSGRFGRQVLEFSKGVRSAPILDDSRQPHAALNQQEIHPKDYRRRQPAEPPRMPPPVPPAGRPMPEGMPDEPIPRPPCMFGRPTLGRPKLGMFIGGSERVAGMLLLPRFWGMV